MLQSTLQNKHCSHKRRSKPKGQVRTPHLHSGSNAKRRNEKSVTLAFNDDSPSLHCVYCALWYRALCVLCVLCTVHNVHCVYCALCILCTVVPWTVCIVYSVYSVYCALCILCTVCTMYFICCVLYVLNTVCTVHCVTVHSVQYV